VEDATILQPSLANKTFIFAVPSPQVV